MSSAFENALAKGKFGDVDDSGSYVEARNLAFGYTHTGEIKRIVGNLTDG